MATAGTLGVYPGTFDPLTVAHLAISDAAVDQLGLTRIDLAISVGALGKAHLGADTVAPRLAAIERAAAQRPWITAVATEATLIADIAVGYDVVVMGADKWAQVNDPAWYGDSEVERDRALRRLPRVVVAPRGDHHVPDDLLLSVPDELEPISSTAVRRGRLEWAADRTSPRRR